MSIEAPSGEPRKDNNQPYEIRLDVPFRPYERVRQNYWPKRGKNAAIYYERYDHTLLLRRSVSLYGILGHIDIISDDPMRSWIEALMKNLPLEKPFGESYFRMIYRGRDDITYTEQTYILRFGFLLRTPADYAKLLNTYVNVEMGKERYMATWNLSIPRVARRMQRLETGEDLALAEKNLFNLKNAEDVEHDGPEGGSNEDFGRVTFVWLPEDLKKLRTIKLTFHRFFGEDDEEQLVDPIAPNRERLLIRT
ncbi:hypothetical protein A3B45_01570 [Candidatus Daviesbacteria bacterium RIFCSPLOWO2_01_FULL_39_12]|uniref:Uncharacterized protein n=1 Tax=Candidatus Daviesbacteria bacterium RIFCSPLOWO2_01_FULL_39_12 TaxID=1797785 RepID=A0A1F5KNG3_9BACT|nr:MAG: hypothetical protein A3D79_02735 [Candidatus Daviesbacteria bacterium RIFCSPHIGHO2_02_FULL_39_8]OGE42473.1 MAG: hypothetical protein A3B45_01570 [Candidatus Daviesbacteria bacterium RIFCSPLOWO2_01_FULL_39_12]